MASPRSWTARAASVLFVSVSCVASRLWEGLWPLSTFWPTTGSELELALSDQVAYGVLTLPC